MGEIALCDKRNAISRTNLFNVELYTCKILPSVLLIVGINVYCFFELFLWCLNFKVKNAENNANQIIIGSLVEVCVLSISLKFGIQIWNEEIIFFNLLFFVFVSFDVEIFSESFVPPNT